MVADTPSDRANFSDPDYYRQQYQTGSDLWSGMEWLDSITADVLDETLSSYPEPVKALDLGCGRGRISRLLSRTGIFTVGIDFLHEVLKSPRVGAEALDPSESDESVARVRGNVFRLPFDSNAFSILVDYGVFHHVRKADWTRYRSCLTSVLKPGGALFVNVFHSNDRHANNSTRSWVYHRGHYDRFFSRSMLDEALGPSFQRKFDRLISDEPHVFLFGLYRHKG